MAQISPITTQPKAFNPIVKPAGIGKEWRHEMCDCPDCCRCCWCALCMSCDVSYSMGEWYCLPYCVPNGLSTLRTKVRYTQGIRGSMCGDVCCSMWCCACIIQQMYQELKEQNKLLARPECICDFDCENECYTI